MKSVTVIGTGFAALTAVGKLRARDASLDITLVGPQAEFVYYPGLLWFISGLSHRHAICVDLRAFVLRNGIRFHQGLVKGIADGGRQVLTATGTVVNEGLIIASGAGHIKLPGSEHVIIPCEGISAIEAIRERLQSLSSGVIAVGFASNPKELCAVRDVYTLEFILGLDNLLRRQGRRNNFKLLFFSSSSQLGQHLNSKTLKRLFKMLHDRRIETYLGCAIKGFEVAKVITDDEEISADLIVFTPGMTGSAWFDSTDLPRSPGGLLKADAHCRVSGWERVYAAGDCGGFPGPEWMPKQARMADLQADAAAANLLLELADKQPNRTFKVKSITVLDNLDKAMLAVRTPKRSFSLPPLRLMYYAKRWYEQAYVRKYQ